MNAFKLFYELTDAIYISLFQAVAVYLLARLIIYLLPWMGASFRYNLLYSSLTLIFVLFIGRLVILSLKFPEEPIAVNAVSEVTEVNKGPFSIKAMILRYSSLIGFIYILTIIVQILLLLWSLLKIHLFKRKKNWQEHALMQSKVSCLRKIMGIKRQVLFYAGEKLTVPFTAGWLKPVIFFPLAALNNLTIEQVEAILIHELAHIRRYDYIFNFFQRVMEIFLFFNPVARVLATEIRREREFCCDDMVLKHSAAHIPYAKALFLLAAGRTSSLVMTASREGQKTSLLARIKRITDMETMTSNGIPKMVALTGMLAFILFLGWTKPSEAVNKGLRKVKAENAATFAGVAAASQVTPVQPLVTAIKLVTGNGSADTIPSTDPFGAMRANSVTLPQPPSVPPVTDVFTALPSPPTPPVPPASSSTLTLPVSPVPPVFKNTIIRGRDTIISDTAGSSAVRNYFNSPEWKKQMEQVRKVSEEVKKQFDSPEWKKQMESIRKQAEEMRKHFNSKEWKSEMEAYRKNSEEMKKKFNSAEWKQKQAEFAKNMASWTNEFQGEEWQNKMKDLQKQAQDISKELQQQFNSPEWKQQMKELQDNAKELQLKTEKKADKQKK